MHTLPLHAPQGKTFIYGLKDPETKLIRYIGKSNDPEKRYRDHLRDKSITYKTYWIKSLAAKGLYPELVILEEVLIECWQERECYWITYYREQSIPLTNLTDGGDGVKGVSPSEETRRKMSEAHKGRVVSEKTCLLLREIKLRSNPMKGKKASEATRAKMSAARTGMKRVISPEHREKLRLANLGKKHSEEEKAKIRASVRITLRNKRAGQFPTLWDGGEFA